MGIFNRNRRTTSSTATSTIIAKGCSVSGEFKVDNDIQIDGKVTGQMHVEGTLIVAESGELNGEVYAKQLIVNGLLDGNCYADRVQVLSKGSVSGKVWSSNLSIEPGGKFSGEAAEMPQTEVANFEKQQEPKPVETEKASKSA